MTNNYVCVCGKSHDFADVRVSEMLARCVDIPNNVNKYYRVVTIEPPCGQHKFLTHSGRWTDGWRDRGAWKLHNTRSEAIAQYNRKTSSEYRHCDRYGEYCSGRDWNPLLSLELLNTQEKRRANQGAIAAQGYTTALTQAQLWGGATVPPVSSPKPSPVKPGLDPLLDLTRRTDTLVTQLATSDFTADHAIERAKLLSEINDYRQRLTHVESTLEIATALIASKS